MKPNNTFDNFLKSFYSDGYKIGMNIFEGEFQMEKLFDAIHIIYNNIDELISTFEEFSRKEGKKIDCKKGCYWCCHQPVFALQYELDYLNNYIRNNFDEQKQLEIKKRSEEKRQLLNDMDEKEILNSKFPCPLLEDGSCSAYPARPMACRIYLSTSLPSCMSFFHKPEDKESVPALLDFPMRAGRMMNQGFKSALKANGVNAGEFRIDEKL